MMARSYAPSFVLHGELGLHEVRVLGGDAALRFRLRLLALPRAGRISMLLHGAGCGRSAPTRPKDALPVHQVQLAGLQVVGEPIVHEAGGRQAKCIDAVCGEFAP